LLDSDTEVGVLSAMWFWKDNNLNNLVGNNQLTEEEINNAITYKINSKGLDKEKRFNIYKQLTEK
jgi:predicted chitinase